MKITIDIGTGTTAELSKKEKAIKLLAKQNLAVLEKLEILSKSPKAINYINNQWLTLKLMLGII